MSVHSNTARMLMIVPSRGRPEALVEVSRAFTATRRGPSRLVVSIDDDDAELEKYLTGLLPSALDAAGSGFVVTEHPELGVSIISAAPEEPMVVVGDNKNVVEALNRAALYCTWATNAEFIGFMGDDSHPRSAGWDVQVVEALEALGTGLAYCNDLIQGEALPTQVIMTRNIPAALGYFTPPNFEHLYIDNVWLAWGQLTGRLTYLPEAILEHMHPAAGKAEWTEGHMKVNSTRAYERGARQFAEYTAGRLTYDVDVVLSLMRQPVPAG